MKADVTEMLQVAFYSMLDDLGATLSSNAEPVPDAKILPEDDWQDNWQPDNLAMCMAQMIWWRHATKKKVHIIPVRTCFCLVNNHRIAYIIFYFHVYWMYNVI